MLTCRQNAVLLASKCHQIDLSILHLYISFIFVTMNKKPHASNFIILLYISQNANMSGKNDEILASWCRWINFLLLHLSLSF